MTEADLIHLFTPRSFPEEVIKGPGDDCAVVKIDQATLLISTDTLLEGVHFDLTYFDFYHLGRKLAAVNLSDIAAMGGSPLWATLNLEWPLGRSLKEAEDLARGLLSRLKEAGACLIGGDTVKAERIGLGLTVIGRPQGQAPIYRQGASPGEIIYVSGPLGASGAALELLKKGLRVPENILRAHLDPLAELDVAQRLAEEGLASAMIDISDGLGLDLFRLCRASQVGAEIHASFIPYPEELDLLPLEHPPLFYVLAGGEDYRLLFTVPEEKSDRVQALGAYPIGRIVPGDHPILIDNQGKRRNISFAGYDHFKKRGAADKKSVAQRRRSTV
ncbi:thiamine-phosphate kinase [Thermosulfuriphilus sp.]